MKTQELIDKIIDLVSEKKATNIVSLNVASRSSITDYFVICDGLVDQHIKSIADFLVDELKKFDVRPFRIDGMENREWIVVDYGDVIVHLFLPHIREQFRLADLWSGKEDPLA